MSKKFFNLFLISLLCLGNFFVLPKNIVAAGSTIHINEVALGESGGQDWIELYIDQDGDYSEYMIYERDDIVKTLPLDFPLEEGDFVIVHINQEGEDEITDENKNGYIDLYSSYSGLIGTDNVITVRDEMGNIVDALCFSDHNEIWARSQQNAFNSAVGAGQWTGTIDGDYKINNNECVDWSGGSEGYSLGRDIDSNDTDNEDVAADDWYLREYQTMGFANRENLEPDILEIEASPDSFILGEEESIFFRIEIFDEDGIEDVEAVNIDLLDLDGKVEDIYDESILYGTYSYEYNLTEDIESGIYNVYFNVLDSVGNEVDSNIEIEIVEPEYSDQIIINEILPNPEGSDSDGEFIELYNESGEEVDLENWQIGDSSSQYVISSDDFISTIISANSYFTIYGDISGISLNNSGGETVSLYQPNEDLLDTIIYSESALESESYCLLENKWNWSIEPTPGKKNEIIFKNNNPEASAGDNIEAKVGESVTFNGGKSTDFDGDTLSFEWDFGDNRKGAGSKTKHTYSKAGNYTAELVVSDGRGGEDSDTLKVEVVLDEESDSASLNSSDDVSSNNDKNLESEDGILGPFSENIIITEVLPNPEGSDTVDEGEFIEIYNKGSEDIDLEGWQIDDEDGGSSPHTIENKIIKSGEYLVFWRGESKLALNNSDEKARLIYPDGEIASEAYYEESAKDDFAYALNSDNNWQWTNMPTPGEANNISNLEEEESESDESNEDSNSEESDTTTRTDSSSKKEDNEKADSENSNIISIKEAKLKDKNTEIKVQGIVISEPSLFSDKTFYVQDTTSGIQIYFSKEDFPKLELGDEITVFGKKSERSGENKINISDKEDVQVLSHKAPLKPKEIKTGELKEDYEGQLIKISGEVVKKSGNVFYLDDGSGKAKVYINKNTGIEKPEFEKGDKMTILGVESETSSGYRLLPRYQSDIREGDGSILTGINSRVGSNFPEAGANILLLILFSLFITLYIYLPVFIYKLKHKN